MCLQEFDPDAQAHDMHHPALPGGLGSLVSCCADHLTAQRSQALQISPGHFDDAIDRAFLAGIRNTMALNDAPLRRCTIFDARRHHTIRYFDPTGRPEFLVADILASAPEPVRVLHFVQSNIPGFPTPQFILTFASALPGWLTIPVDGRALGHGLCTLNVCPGISWTALGESLTEDCQTATDCSQLGNDVTARAASDQLILRTATEQLPNPLPQLLETVEWIRASGRPPPPPIPVAGTQGPDQEPMQHPSVSIPTDAPEQGRRDCAVTKQNLSGTDMPPQTTAAIACVATAFGRRHVPSTKTVAIRIADALPASTEPLQQVKDAMRDVQYPWLQFWERDISVVPDVPPGMQAYFRQLKPVCAPPVCVHVFTDGSFETPKGIASAGWAVVVVLETLSEGTSAYHLMGFRGGSTTDFAKQAIGAEFSSYSAEIQAAIVACTWFLSVPPDCPVHLWTDNSAVFQIINGTASPGSPSETLSLPERLRCLVHLVQACKHSLTAGWLPGHAGNPFNELADRVAKAASKNQMPTQMLSKTLWRVVASVYLPWMWMLPGAASDLPSLEHIIQGQYEPADPVPADCFPVNPADEAEEVKMTADVRVALHFVSYNVQSLLTCREIVLQQLIDRHVTVCGMQETRARTASQCQSRHFFEFASAAVNGEGGCSLLFARNLPYAKVKGKALHFSKDHFRCVLADHRRLAVTVTAPHCTMLCLVAHAPHSGASHCEIREWWDKLHRDVLPFTKDRQCIGFVDANAQVGSVTDDSVGNHAAALENFSGECFRDWMGRFQLFAPSTFFNRVGACVPAAAEPTWTSPKGTQHRIDYIALPQSWQMSYLAPTVCEDFVTMTIDHYPVSVKCDMQLIASTATPGSKGLGLPLEPDALPEEAKHVLLGAIQHLPLHPWHHNVHKHTQSVYDAVRLAAQDAKLAAPRTRKCRPFLSDTSKFWLESERAMGRAVRTFNRLFRRAQLGACMRAWRGQTPFRTREGWSVAQVQLMRQRAIQRAAQPFDSKAFFKAISALRPPGKRVRKPFQPLIVDPDRADAGPVDLAITQRTHFAQLEAGISTTSDEYLEAANSRYQNPRPPGTFRLQDLPSLFELERSLRSAKNGKAPGPNAIPEWIWKLDVPAAARAFYPIFLKAHVRLCEPIQFKSTALIAMFKGKGAMTCVHNFRAIALMDGPGKQLRKGVRRELVAALPENDLMQGGIPGSLLQAAHHVVRTYVSLAAHAQTSSAVLFLDVASAYYRVLRQSLWESGPEDDAALCTLLARLQVAPDAVHEVCGWLHQANLLQQAPPHTSRLVREFLSGTFFQMRGAPGTIATGAGTRPGDAIADLLFALVQADFLRNVQCRLRQEGLTEDPLQSRAGLDNMLLSPVWADDTAMLFADGSASALLPKIRSVLTVVHECFLTRGMQPNYSKGKTELLLSFRGKGAPALRRRIHVREGGTLRFLDKEQRQITVGCVRSYLHLGGRIEDRPSVLADVVQHIASGLRQIKPLARPFLRSPLIPLESRKLCLQSLALTAACCTSATWGPMTLHERDAWRKGYTTLHRLLGRDDRWTGKPSLPGEVAVCRHFGCPSPVAFLRGQRLLHFSRIVPGHHTLYALMRADLAFGDVAWLSLLRQDLDWLALNARVPAWATEDFPNGALRWAVEQPVAIRSAVKKALRGVDKGTHEPLWQKSEEEGPLRNAHGGSRPSKLCLRTCLHSTVCVARHRNMPQGPPALCALPNFGPIAAFAGTYSTTAQSA